MILIAIANSLKILHLSERNIGKISQKVRNYCFKRYDTASSLFKKVITTEYLLLKQHILTFKVAFCIFLLMHINQLRSEKLKVVSK